MANFRTGADILDQVLHKAGESPNGGSPYETTAIIYLNKVHHAIVGGGNIFDLEVNEPWTWARAKHPIVFELEPAITNGSATCTTASSTITFSSAPAASVEGWHFQVNGKSTVYRITNHTAGNTSAQIDSNFVDGSGGYGFRAFKLDYEIMPNYLYVDNANDRIEYRESAGTTLSATLTHGTYSPSALITHVASQMQAGGTATYTGAYDSVSRLFSISNNVTGALIGLGPNARRSVLPTLGFDRLNFTAAASYTSSYVPNSIATLVEPLKIFQGGYQQPFIYSTDSMRMQQDYPISQITERVPDRFVRLTEENDGTVRVRFNAYPREKVKVSADWIPVPQDIQDNAVSFPLLPRSDVDTLIHGAAALICFDKEDDKWEGLWNLAKAGILAMRRKNRALLSQTGEDFAQITPRADLAGPIRKLGYGYTAGD